MTSDTTTDVQERPAQPAGGAAGAGPGPAAAARPSGRSLWERGDDGLVVLRLGPTTENGMLTLTEERLTSFDACLDEIRRTFDAAPESIRGVVVTGTGPRMFAAGADVAAIEGLTTVEAGRAAAARGQAIFHKLETLPVPTVAALGGPCLGGGLELALACTRRVAADDPSTRIGLPEVKLGILPGFGGSQRLPRLVGLPKALDLILQGKMLDAQRARRSGVVDRAVAPERLLEAAREELEKLQGKKGRARARRRLKGFAWAASRLAPMRALVARKVRKTLESGPARFYPAPKKALECCVAAFSMPRAKGYAFEAQRLGELVASPESKALVRLFFLTERSKKLGRADGARAVERALVVGGGVMGAGIASLMAAKGGVRVRLTDVSPDNLAAAKARLARDLDKKLKRRRLQKHEAMAAQDRLAVAQVPGDLRRTDLWLEAVPEVLDLKQTLAAKAVEAGLPDDAVLATNTSSLSIDAVAGDLPHPERVVGIHFFNPPEKMPLVEIVRGARTDDATVATAARLALDLGKFPVVVRDVPGFLVNRCLAPYLDEATRLMLEGASPELVDEVALDFGFPMGPARLLDEIGLDVAQKVSEVLGAAFAHMQPSPLIAKLVEAGHLGNKKGGCFYKKPTKSGKGGNDPGPGRGVLASMSQAGRSPEDWSSGGAATRSEIRDRLLLPMVAEAWRCLEEGVVASEDDIDLGLVFGIGFPPFLGGLTRWARHEGLGALRARMEALQAQHGDRFAPPADLRD